MPDPSPLSPKDVLRQQARTYRATLSPEKLAEASQQVCHQLSNWQAYQQAAHILLYSPTASELDLLPLLGNSNASASQTPKTFYLTRTWQGSRQLTLHRFDANTELETHRYGYRQPVATSPQIHADAISMVLVPGLLFDTQGGRLGYGGGYYDRLLATMPQAIFVATILKDMVRDTFPTGIIEPHDITMHYLATEAAVHPVHPQEHAASLL